MLLERALNYFATMQASEPLDVDLIKGEIAKMFGSDCEAKFNRAIDDAVVQVYGGSLLHNDRYQEALPVFEKELAIQRRRGDDESRLAGTHLQLGTACAQLGNYAESLLQYEEARVLYGRCFGSGHCQRGGNLCEHGRCL